MRLDPGVRYIVDRLRGAGHRVLLAGGCVRDFLRGDAPVDWDLVTDAAPQQVMDLFDRTVAVGARFGIVVVVLDGRTYEVAQFRSERGYSDGRRPRTVAPADPRTDAQRRDFTINGLFMDPCTGQLLDYVGGQEDLQRGLIRAIGDPSRRFAEDHLRMLRAVRFAARLDFVLDAETGRAIRRLAGRIRAISAERICAELTWMLTGPRPGRALRLLDELELLREVLPEVSALKGISQPPEFHPEGDVWTHTVRAVELLDRPSAVLAWATLLHDTGKPAARTVTDRIRFHGHEIVGGEIAAEVTRRLRMSNKERKAIVRLVAEHMRLGHAREMRPGKLKRLLGEAHGRDLLSLHRVDCLASHGDLSIYDFCREKLGELDARPAPVRRLLTGDDLIGLGFVPGPLFRRILDAVEEQRLEGRVISRQEAIRFVMERFGRALNVSLTVPTSG